MPNRLVAALALAAMLACASCSGNDPAYAGSLAGLQPFFAARLSALLHALPGITISSGYRSPAAQAALYARAWRQHGSAAALWAAPPGQSMHQLGLAADLHFPSPRARAEAHAVAGSFGLTFPMAWEGWHIEAAGARAQLVQNLHRFESGSVLAYVPAAPGAAALAAAVPWPVRHAHRHYHGYRHHGWRHGGRPKLRAAQARPM